MKNTYKLKHFCNKNRFQSAGQISLILFVFLFLSACIDLVEDGIDVSYLDSEATVKVEPIDFEQAAAGETISYSIEVNSSFDIKSCIVQAAKEGRNGSGFNVSDDNFDDPFADHIFGTVREGIRSFKVRYDYIIPDDINKSRISFTIIDDSGKAGIDRTIEVVPAIKKYEGLELYAQDKTFNDALATIDGKVYTDIKTNYSSFTETNVAVQEKIDFIFFYDQTAKRSTLAAPSSGRVNLELSIENKTVLKRMNNIGALSLDQITPSLLHKLTAEEDILENGSTQIDNLKVGNVIGFVTDLNAVNSLKAGLLFITALHPATVDRYDGVSYVLECDMIVQQ